MPRVDRMLQRDRYGTGKRPLVSRMFKTFQDAAMVSCRQFCDRYAPRPVHRNVLEFLHFPYPASFLCVAYRSEQFHLR